MVNHVTIVTQSRIKRHMTSLQDQYVLLTLDNIFTLSRSSISTIEGWISYQGLPYSIKEVY